MPVREHAFVRHWTGDPADLLARLRAVFEQEGFRLSAPSQWNFEGERGSSVSLSRLDPALVVRAGVTRDSEGTVRGHVHLADKMPEAFRAVTFERGLHQTFVDLERAVDVLLELVPPPSPATGSAVPGPTPPPVRPVAADAPAPTQPAGGIAPAPTQPARGIAPAPTQPASGIAPAPAPLERQGSPDGSSPVQPSAAQSAPGTDGIVGRAGAALEKLGEKAQQKTSAMLGRGGSEPWQKVESVTFWCPPDQATADAQRIQVYAAVAAMVASQPDALPEKLAGELSDFIEQVRKVLNSAAEADMTKVRADIEPSQRPILEFLEQQARLREELPVRTLHRCRDCGQQKVSNPDYTKLKERNRKMQALSGAVGLTLRGGSVSPFVLVGALFRLRKLDPDYVCPRCQGMDAEETIATFCPECGGLRSEAVLRRCPECKHDLRSALAPMQLWQSTPTAVAPGGSTARSAGGG